VVVEGSAEHEGKGKVAAAKARLAARPDSPKGPSWPRRPFDDAFKQLTELVGKFPGDRGVARAGRTVNLGRDCLKNLSEQLPTPPPVVIPQLLLLGALMEDLQRTWAPLLEKTGTFSEARLASDELLRLSAEISKAFAGLLDGLRGSDQDQEGPRPFEDRFLEEFVKLFRNVGEEIEQERASLADGDVLAPRTTDTEFARHFGDYARDERSTANLLQVAAVVVIVAITVLAAVLVLVIQSDGSGSDVGNEIAKLALTVPLAALAAYLGKESSRHRRDAQWAAAIEVQLLSVDSYAQTLADTDREQLRRELGRRGFAVPRTDSQQADGAENGPSAVADLAGLLEQATNAVKSLAGSSEPSANESKA
jgi:hypothetical protein